MELKATFIIDVNNADNLLCGECISKKPISFGSGQPDYRCLYFDEYLKFSKTQPSNYEFGQTKITERCIECLRRFKN